MSSPVMDTRPIHKESCNLWATGNMSLKTQDSTYFLFFLKQIFVIFETFTGFQTYEKLEGGDEQIYQTK